MYEKEFEEGKFSVLVEDARAVTLVDWNTGGEADIFFHSLIKENNRFDEILKCLKGGITDDTVMMGAAFKLLGNGEVKVGDVRMDQKEFEAFKAVCDWNLKSLFLFDWNKVHKDMIVTAQPFLSRALNFCMIEDEARASGLITEEMAEKIRNAGIRELQRVLLRPGAVETFMEILLKTDQTRIFKRLLRGYSGTFMKRYGTN